MKLEWLLHNTKLLKTIKGETKLKKIAIYLTQEELNSIVSSLNNNYFVLEEQLRFSEDITMSNNTKDIEHEMNFIDNLLARLEKIDFNSGE